MREIFGSISTVLMAIVGLAIIAVVVSRNANTAGVIGAAGDFFTGSLSAAVSPVQGGGGLNPKGSIGGRASFSLFG